MKHITNWVFTRPQGAEYWLLPLFIVAWDQLYNIVVAQLLYSNTLAEGTIATEEVVLVASWQFPFELILGATLEELVFRIIPLVILLRYMPNKLVTGASVLALSVAFAFIHGGWPTLLLQGIGGVVYSIVFLKYADNGKRILEASAVVILVHIIFNIMAVLLSVSSGGDTF